MPRNPYICLIIVASLGLTVLFGMLGIIVTGIYGKEVPVSLVSIVSGCVGSLSSFLVTVPRGTQGLAEGNPQQIIIPK